MCAGTRVLTRKCLGSRVYRDPVSVPEPPDAFVAVERMEERPASWADIVARTDLRKARSSFRLLGVGAVALTVVPWLSSPSSALMNTVAAASLATAMERTSTNTTAPALVPATGMPAELTTPPSLVASSSTSVSVHDAPEGAGPGRTFDPAEELGGQLVFLVKEEAPEWLEVYLPIRPNGSTGWVRRDEVELSQHQYRIELSLAEHRLVVLQGDEIVLDTPAGIGDDSTPTPGGVYYLEELLRPPDPDGFYGPYAYGLSGFSDTVTDYNGGEGVIGIHGTDDPTSIGSDVSRGCIRLDNEVITRLVEEIGLPLGTPVVIDA